MWTTDNKSSANGGVRIKMNIICILAGGVGNRFGSPVPKQYHLINGRPVIEYVIDAAIKSSADEVVVATDAENMSALEEKYGVITVKGGKNRNQSIYNVMCYIEDHYSCEKIILVDAVCPLVREDFFDQYFNLLYEYDAVFTTAEITTSISGFDRKPVNRHDFFLIQSPDAYWFDLLRKAFDKDSQFTTPLHMLPSDAKVKYNYNFKDYIKIIYPHDLAIAEALIRERERHIKFEAHANDTVLSLFSKLRKIDREGTKKWEKHIDKDVERLFFKWEIYEFSVNRDAYTGLVLECKSRKHGDVVIKMYPPFLSRRYVKESFVMLTLKNYSQAPILDVDEKRNAMLLSRVIPGDYIDYYIDKVDIAAMFRYMFENKTAAKNLNTIPKEIRSVIELTEDEFVTASKYDYNPKRIEYLLSCSKSVYSKYFVNEEKYLLHGDAYYKNALRSEDGIRVIDPVGYVDSFVFEYMPFLTYELVLHTEPEDYASKYNELVDFFSTFTDTGKFNAATFVFLVKQLVPSIYEANDSYKRANSYLRLIKELFLDENNELSLYKISR